ncbi:MAG: cupin [Oscillatoriales cyanobacterium SM2_2_1]|nr:cupin [Oscillatoriales cyanobacterium SM2_2_1]
MKIRNNFAERVVVNTEELPWLDSPLAGVQRRLLDRIGGEVARATSIVRYAPGSHFSEHIHGGGEEFLVLSGTFSDEYGDYPVGTYVRNPPTSHHSPHSREGCTIFVKLWQMEPEDTTRVVIRDEPGNWMPGLVEGLAVLPLHTFGTEHVALVQWAPGTKFPAHRHVGGEEILVLSGTFADERGCYPAGTWLRNPPHSVHSPFSEEGCLIWVKTGHLQSCKIGDHNHD